MYLPSRSRSERILPFKTIVITVQDPCHKLQQAGSLTLVTFNRHYAALLVSIQLPPTKTPHSYLASTPMFDPGILI